MEKEKWFESRRMWGAVLTFIAALCVIYAPDNYDFIIGAMTLIASALGLTSFIAPKKK